MIIQVKASFIPSPIIALVSKTLTFLSWSSSKWKKEDIHLPPLKDGRSFLFAKMANVRNWEGSGIEPISLPKGIPSSITFSTGYDLNLWGRDAHSDSYLTSSEVRILLDWYKQDHKWSELFGYLFGNSYAYFEEGSSSYPANLQDFRFVFWFDN